MKAIEEIDLFVKIAQSALDMNPVSYANNAVTGSSNVAAKGAS